MTPNIRAASESNYMDFTFTAECLEDIRASAVSALNALPRRGLEVGGFLTVPGLKLLMVESEYLHGPCYIPSLADLERLADAKRACERDGRKVVAWFRSCPSREPGVDSDDENAIARICPEVRSVVLAVPSFTESTRLLVFRPGRAGAWEKREEVGLMAAARPATMNVSPEREAGGTAAPFSPSLPQPLPRIPHATPVSTRPTGVQYGWLMAAGVAVALIAAAGRWVWIRSDSEARLPVAAMRQPGSQELDLQVRDEDGQLRLIWTAPARAISPASRGTLTFTEGGVSRAIELSADDLNKAAFAYAPRSSDINIAMRVFTADGKSLERLLRVIGNRVTESKLSDDGKGEFIVAPAAVTEPTETVRASGPARRRVFTIDQIPRATRPLVSPAMLTDAPVPQFQKATTLPVDFPAVSLPSLPPGRQINAGVVSTPALAEREKLTTATAHPREGIERSTGAVTAPVPLARVMPAHHNAGTRLLQQPVTIGVLVDIDENGRVTTARPEATARPQSPQLQNLAIGAARQWTFRPAIRDGQPVAARQRIEFQFRPDTL